MTQRQARPRTVLRRALREESTLNDAVIDGMGAVKQAHKTYFDEALRTAFEDSLDLDEALRAGHERDHRWDYLLGHVPSGEVVAVEPHSAKQDEISTVINKKITARDHLRDHLREGAHVSRWIWVSSGKNQFADTEKARRRLDQNGIQFVGARVTAKYLAPAQSTGTVVKRRRTRSR